MEKAVFLDLETTGTSPGFHEIVQLGAIITFDWEVKEEFMCYMRPRHPERIDKGALASHKIPVADMLSFPFVEEGVKSFMALLDKYRHIYPEEKYVIYGQNTLFDSEHLYKLIYKYVGSNAYYEYFYHKRVDLLSIVTALQHKGLLPKGSLKLDELCRLFNIQRLKSHDALEDIKGTYKLFHTINNAFIRSVSEVDLSHIHPESEIYSFLTQQK